MSEDRLISPQAVEDELVQDRALRPKLLTDYVGQEEVASGEWCVVSEDRIFP